ncbi:MAG: hypothetical protein E7122_00320 [Bacteroidales bacterium]|nr:hypothetical protein [Bacteroidales bacterium]
MKKLLSLIIACALGFGMISCVETEESQALVELRNAKAEQLKALTNLYNAQAEAARITAQAEAALKAAQAAYQQAQADYKKEELEQLKKKFEIQLEALIAQYQASIAQYKFQKADYEKRLMDKLAEIEAAEKAKIIALYNQYSEYSDALNDANANLIQYKVQMARVENEIVDIQEAAEKAISEQKEIIAENEALIAEEEAKLAVYNNHEYAGMNTDSLELEVVKANMAWRNALAAYENKELKAVEEAREVAATARQELYDERGEVDPNSFVWVRYNTTGIDYWPVLSGGTTRPWYTFFVDESELDTWKNTVLNTNLEEAVATATENLEKAEAALEAFKGFEDDFAKAAQARAALYAYDQAYENYNETEETVEYAEAQVKDWTREIEEVDKKYLAKATAQLDTLKKVDLAKFTSEDYNKWNFAFWTRTSSMTNSMNAFYNNLLNLEYAKEQLKAAQDAQKALAATATDAEKKAAQDAVDNAAKAVEEATKAVKTAYDKVIYEAETRVANWENWVVKDTQSKEEWEEKLAAAKENKTAFEAAFAPAKEAIATLEELYGTTDTDFRKFWNENSFYCEYNQDGYYTSTNTSWRYNYNLAADRNNDNKPDMNLNPDGTVVDGLYLMTSDSWIDFAPNYNNYYFTKDEAYVGPDFDKMVAHYVTLVAEAQDALTEANNNLANANEWKTNWDAKEKELRDWVASANERIPEIQKLVDAYYAAVETAEAAAEAVTELKGKFDAVSQLLSLANGYYAPSGYTTIASLIANCESNIEDAKAAIEDAEKQIKQNEGYLDGTYSWSNSVPYKEYLISWYKLQIEKYTAAVELYSKLAEDAKAALDAAMSAADAE